MFYLERFNGNVWVTFRIAPFMVNPNDIKGPDQYPPAETPGNISAFAGKPGWKCRIRCDDVTIEEFDWAEIISNPMDPDSPRVWGWKPIVRNYNLIPLESKVYPLSVLG